jgi:hypothetical protein
MDKTLNFEDSLFIINKRIRMIQSMLKLDCSSELFEAVTNSDCTFIEAALGKLQTLLEENTRFIDREAQFHNIIETDEAFLSLLCSFLSDESVFNSSSSETFKEKVKKIALNIEEKKRELEETALTLSGKPVQEPVVSSMDLTELLRGIT